MFADHADFTAIKIHGCFQYQVITENCGPNLKHPQLESPTAQLQIPTWHLSSRELLSQAKITSTYCNHAGRQEPLFRS